MKKYIILFVTVLLVSIILVGCAFNTNEAGNNETVTENNEVIKVKHVTIKGNYVFEDDLLQIINVPYDMVPPPEAYVLTVEGLDTVNFDYNHSGIAEKYKGEKTVVEKEITVTDRIKNKSEVKIDGKTISVVYAGTSTDDYGRVRFNYKKSKDDDEIIISLDENEKLIYYRWSEGFESGTKALSEKECREKVEKFLLSETSIDPSKYGVSSKMFGTARLFTYTRAFEGIETSCEVQVFVNPYTGRIEGLTCYKLGAYSDDMNVSFDKSAFEQMVLGMLDKAAKEHSFTVEDVMGNPVNVIASLMSETAEFTYSFVVGSEGVMCVSVNLEVMTYMTHLDEEGNPAIEDNIIEFGYWDGPKLQIFDFYLLPEA